MSSICRHFWRPSFWYQWDDHRCVRCEKRDKPKYPVHKRSV